MTKYINKHGYSDVYSYRITDINEAKGTATAQAVKIQPDLSKAKCFPGGFCAHWENLAEAFENGTIVDNGEKFPIIKRNGAWGHWVAKWSFDVRQSDLSISLDKYCEDNPKAERWTDSDGMEHATLYERTKSGKIAMTFSKLGTELENVCRYYEDWNY